MTNWDVIVVGAGPAGAIAAREVALRGFRTLLIDATQGAEHKVGEALPAAGARILRKLGLNILNSKSPHTRIGGTLSSWDSDELIPADSVLDPEGAGWRLDRLRFDGDIRSAAILAGAEHTKGRVRNAQRDGANWRIQLHGGTECATRWLIDASGRAASIARRMGACRRRDSRLVAQYALGNRAVQRRVDRTIVEAVPEGWWYAAILPSGVPCAGFHGGPDQVVRLASGLLEWSHAFSQTRHVASLLAGAQFDRLLPPLEACGARLDQFAGDGWIACGDAALSFDPVSGQGLLSAIHSGMMAARAAIEALHGVRTGITAHCEKLAEIHRIYHGRQESLYRSAQRWHETPFWANFGG